MGTVKSSPLLLAAFGAICTSSLVGVALYVLGPPLTLFTWIAVALCAASGITLGLTPNRRFVFFPAALLFCVYLAMPGLFSRAVESQFQAVLYQQQGTWGGHPDFGEAFRAIVLGRRKPIAASQELGRRVIWWPERQTRNTRRAIAIGGATP